MIEANLLHRIRQHSGIPLVCLNDLYDLVSTLDIPGAVVECGVANGGSAALIWTAAGTDRRLWLFDSFQGLPMPTEPDGGRAFAKYEYRMQTFGHWCKGSQEIVKGLMETIGPLENVTIVPGWIEATLPECASQIGEIAMLHIDVDFYEPTKCALEYLRPLVVKGGLVVVDDYIAWQGCKTAVDEFAAENRITPLQMFGSPVYWRVT